MRLSTSKKFDKDFRKLRDKKVQQGILKIIEEIDQSDKLSDIGGLLKLKGYQRLYRIKRKEITNYRIVLSFDNETVTLLLLRVLHRKDIYDSLN